MAQDWLEQAVDAQVLGVPRFDLSEFLSCHQGARWRAGAFGMLACAVFHQSRLSIT
jgi:hypothetical protein